MHSGSEIVQSSSLSLSLNGKKGYEEGSFPEKRLRAMCNGQSIVLAPMQGQDTEISVVNNTVAVQVSGYDCLTR